MKATSNVSVREAEPADAAAIARIYAEGIEDRVATFRTTPHGADVFAERIRVARPVPMLVAHGAAVVGWAAVLPYSEDAYYAGVGEYQIYVARSVRGGGVGRLLLEALIARAEENGYWKLIGKLFASNEASIALARRCGFREVGVHLRHGRLDGEWRDVVVVERSLGPAA